MGAALGGLNVRESLHEASGLQYAGQQETLRHPYLKHVGTASLALGMLCVVVVWICAFGSFGFTTTQLALYLLVLAVPLTILEFSWIIGKCACCSESGFCGKVWLILMQLNLWKRGVVYILVAIPCFIIVPVISTLNGVLCGLLLFVLGLLYIAKTFQFTTQPVYSFQGGPAPPGGQANYTDPQQYQQSQQFQASAAQMGAQMMQDPAVMRGVVAGAQAYGQARAGGGAPPY